MTTRNSKKNNKSLLYYIKQFNESTDQKVPFFMQKFIEVRINKTENYVFDKKF